MAQESSKDRFLIGSKKGLESRSTGAANEGVLCVKGGGAR